jgi:hypothetical protein
MPEERIPKLIMEWIPWGEKEKGTPKENVDVRSTSGHDNKKFRTRSMEKEREWRVVHGRQRQLLKISEK